MQINRISPNKSLNSAYRKLRVHRPEIESYKTNFDDLLNKIDYKADEEHLKYLLADFLKKTWYQNSNQVNPIAKNDLVIHLGKLPSDPIGVILEIKSPRNAGEMISVERPNVKSLHELILYYFRERLDNRNNQIKNLIISNIYEWYIFDANEFDKKIFNNHSLKKLYDLKINDNKLNTFFYDEVSALLDSQVDLTLNATYFNINDIKKGKDDSKFIIPYKILSPSHLLKEPFKNDSNSLDKDFYNELLHIIGLEENDGPQKLIGRKPDAKRESGSLLENTLNKIDASNKLPDLDKLSSYGTNYSDQIFAISLELVITWVNRILFLKLLESQIIKYHKGDRTYAFLQLNKISDYSELNELFFEVLARTPEKRITEVKSKFKNVPYLNSSLFEPTYLEKKVLTINNLNRKATLKYYGTTVIEDKNGKKPKIKVETLEYIFSFLNSYDFSSEGDEEIIEEKKTLINASVLGLIFEKINGYKEGSFFTPGRITMFMCRESIRRVVIDKFNQSSLFQDKELVALDFDDLKHKLNYADKDIRNKANSIINKIRICDPAVGSGHFLVSALNEIIVLKYDLSILSYADGAPIRGYIINNDNDELNIIDEESDKPFNYILNENNRAPESLQKLQVALFHEKQNIIENCLFGVDINPNSVHICRLRLWIELLKNAYYIASDNSGGEKYERLETLPNIDINIKPGNSLINRFELRSNLRQNLKKKDISIKKYRAAVSSYQNAKSKEEKSQMEALIESIKNDFRSVIGKSAKEFIDLEKLEREFYLKYESTQLFDENFTTAQIKYKKELRDKIQNLKSQIESILSNKIFQNAFEWRFEFPEVLNIEGDFEGFDLVIGNPPYGNLITDLEKSYYKRQFASAQGPFDIYKFFIEKSLKLLNTNGIMCFITPNTWINLSYFKKIRLIVTQDYKIEFCSETLFNVFEEATVDTNIFGIKNVKDQSKTTFDLITKNLSVNGIGNFNLTDGDAIIALKSKPVIIDRIEENCINLSEFVDVWRGMSAYGAKNEERPYNSFSKTKEAHRPLLNGGDIGKYQIKWSGEYILFGEWLHRSRPSQIYDQPHLLVQRIRNPKLKDRIIATYDDKKFISSDGLSNILCKKHIVDKELELKFLLAIINSKLINYWFAFYFFDVNIKPEQIRLIPIKKASKELKMAINNIVNYLLYIGDLKNVQINEYVPNSHISQEFVEILDALIYELYFPNVFNDAEISIGIHIPKLFLSIVDNDKNALNTIHNTYQELRNKDNEVRNNLKLMEIRLSSLVMPFKT